MYTLSCANKALSPNPQNGTAFPFRSVDVIIDPIGHVLCVHCQGTLLSTIPLNVREYEAMLIFYAHYPHYVPDYLFKKGGINARLLFSLRDKMRRMGFIEMERIRQTGYYLVEECPTSSPLESRMQAFSS